MRLGRGFSEPLMRIVRGTQDIAEGAASLRLDPADEELATLARAIDSMAGRIAEGRRRLTREKKVIELMVENINAAVVSLDAERRVVLHNRLARELLGARVGRRIGEGAEEDARLGRVARFAAGSGDQPRQLTELMGGTITVESTVASEDMTPMEQSLFSSSSDRATVARAAVSGAHSSPPP